MMDSTSGYPGAIQGRVTKPKEYDEQVSFLAREGTHSRIEAVLGDVKKADFLRQAVDDAIDKARRQSKRRGA